MKRQMIDALKHSRANKRFREKTYDRRLDPSFHIVGTQKGGTTSLFAYLRNHDMVRPPLNKEVHYYDTNYQRGIEWYQAQFPWASDKYITGEASPYYMYHPRVPARLYQDYPESKIIFLLRNPIERAYSHYQHNVRKKREDLTFPEAIEREEAYIHEEEARVKNIAAYNSYFHQHYSYISRGRYAEQLERWMNYFPQEQLFIMQSETFYSNPKEAYEQVVNFLGLPEDTPEDFPAYNTGNGYEGMDEDTIRRLKQYYEPHQRELEKLTGQSFTWEI